MRPGDDSQDGAGEVRVTDKRRFTSAGDMRDGEPEGHGGAAASAAARTARHEDGAADEREADTMASRPPAPSRAQQENSAAGRTADHGAEPGVYDLGIQAVFFVFYQSALIALGVPEVTGEPREPDLVDARQAIDFLRVLEAKTAGNLTPTEAETLRQLLDDAQLRYVHVARGLAGGGA